METYKKISEETLEITDTRELKSQISKSDLLEQKQKIEDLLKKFD